MNLTENIIINFDGIENSSKAEILESHEILNETFCEKKKKKKHKSKDENLEEKKINDIERNENENENENDNNDKMDNDLLLEFDLKLKKKKKKNKEKNLEFLVNENIKNIDTNFILSSYDPPSYSYPYLLNRIYENLQDINININQKIIVKMPIVQRLGSKKTGWTNFTDCCRSLNRELVQLQNFTLNELSTEGSIDSNNYFIFKGIYTQKNIELILRKFVVSYVQCNMCKGLETCIRKDTTTRLSFLDCLLCKSNRALQQINYGYRSKK